MSDMNDKKDYDLDYFNSHNDESVSDNSDLMSGNNVGGDDEFNLNGFSGDSGLDDASPFASDYSGDSDESVDLSSYGKKQGEIKKETRRKNKKETKDKVKKIALLVLKIFFSVMLIGIITGCLVVGAFAIYVFNFVDDKVYEDLDELALGFTTTIYVEDETSGEYVEYQRLHGEENRIWVDFEQMPENLKNAFVAVEDQRFREHQGVDWKRTVGAFANMFVDLYSSNQGGSTITQQLVKNLTNDNKQTPMRKIREIMRARYLEENYHKDTILECYLNTICLGGGIYGVEVAANYYFGKTTNELTLVECAALASLAKEPERYRPDRNPKFNQERRNIVLRLMKEQGYISDEVYQSSKATEIQVVADESAKNLNTVNSYFVDALIEEVIDRLVDEYGMDEAYASKNFYNGGYKIYCTLNPNVQNILEDEYSKTDKYFTLKSKESGKTVQSAMTIMDYEGHIVGIVGGSGVKKDNRGYNRATMAFRQPGSTMKPLATYSQALQKNIIHFSSMIEDKALPNYYPDGRSGPKNSYGYYQGMMTAAEALERSTNTIPCHLIKQMGVESTYYYLTNNLGLTELDSKQDANLSSLGLGGTYTGVSTTQSAAAFAVFGNLGTYYEPTTFTLMTDQHDNVVLKQKSGIAAIDENTATVLNYMLRNVVYGSKGTAKAIASFSDKFVCYAKTGTTSDVYDSWLVGGTPYYVGSCWFGYDQQEKLNNSSLAKTMWKNVMKRVHKDLPEKTFVDSEFVTPRYYCKSTGLLATDACESKAEGRYKTNYSLPAVCTKHPGNVLPPIGSKPEEATGAEKPSNGNTSKPSDSSKPSAGSSANGTTSATSSVTSSGNGTTSSNTQSTQGTSSVQNSTEQSTTAQTGTTE